MQFQKPLLFLLALGKGKNENIVFPSSELYLFFWINYSGQKNPYILVLLTAIGGRVGYHEVNVLGSQVFGHTLMESCSIQ